MILLGVLFVRWVKFRRRLYVSRDYVFLGTLCLQGLCVSRDFVFTGTMCFSGCLLVLISIIACLSVCFR